MNCLIPFHTIVAKLEKVSIKNKSVGLCRDNGCHRPNDRVNCKCFGLCSSNCGCNCTKETCCRGFN